MSYKLADGDKVISKYTGWGYTVKSVIGSTLLMEGMVSWEDMDDYYLKEGADQPTLYTPEELSEIDELRDEVDKLNDLCSEYAKIIAEKDKRIAKLIECADELFDQV